MRFNLLKLMIFTGLICVICGFIKIMYSIGCWVDGPEYVAKQDFRYHIMVFIDGVFSCCVVVVVILIILFGIYGIILGLSTATNKIHDRIRSK